MSKVTKGESPPAKMRKMRFHDMPNSPFFRNRELKFLPSQIDPEIFELYQTDLIQDPRRNKRRVRKERWIKEMIGSGQVASLAQLCLYVFADNFDLMYSQVPDIPSISFELFIQLLPTTVDMGYAALVIRDGGFWRKCAEHKWAGYHCIEFAGDSWKRYVIERYFAEYLENAEIDSIDYLEAKRLAENFSPFIQKLEIKQLNVPPWPRKVETTDSTSSSKSSASNGSGMTNLTLDTYMNRHVKYEEHPVSTDRIYLGSIFRSLEKLEEFKISFGFKNYLRHSVLSFANINRLDTLRFGSAIEAIKSLTKLSITSTIFPEEMWDIVRDSIECHQNLKELELSRMQMGDDGIINIIHILATVNSIKSIVLKENGFTSMGIAVLAQAIMQRQIKLQVLDLSFNKLDDVGGSILASFILQHRFIKKLFLCACNLGAETGRNFGLAIKFNTSLEVLDLSVNDFDITSAKALLRGIEKNKTMCTLDVRGCNLPKLTVSDINKICFENSEKVRIKEPVYPRINPKSVAPKIINFPPESEDDEDEILAKEAEMKLKLEMMEEKKKKIQAFISRRLSEISDNVSDISDFLRKKNDALSRAGFTGTFSSGFGPGIDGYVEETERRQLYEARKEVFDIEAAAVPAPVERTDKQKRMTADKKDDNSKLLAFFVFDVMGFEQRKRLFGDLDAEDVITVIQRLIKDRQISSLRSTAPGEYFKRYELAYVPSGEEVSDQESSLFGEGEDEEGEEEEDSELDSTNMLFAADKERALINEENSEVYLEGDEASKDVFVESLEEMSSTSEASYRKVQELQAKLRITTGRDSDDEPTIEVMHKDKLEPDSDQELSDEPAFYDYNKFQEVHHEYPDMTEENWEMFTVWGGKLTKLRGPKSRNIWIRRKWEYFLKQPFDDDDQGDEFDDDEELDKSSTSSLQYEIYSSDSVAASSDGELTSENDLPYWCPQIQRLY